MIIFLALRKTEVWNRVLCFLLCYYSNSSYYCCCSQRWENQAKRCCDILDILDHSQRASHTWDNEDNLLTAWRLLQGCLIHSQMKHMNSAATPTLIVLVMIPFFCSPLVVTNSASNLALAHFRFFYSSSSSVFYKIHNNKNINK